MRIIVIGGTGFIGPHVVRRLDAMGHEVVIFHRGHSEVDLPAGVCHLHGNRDQLEDFRHNFTRLAPDVVVDMRPMIESHAQALVRTFTGIARRVVALSSCDVYRAYGIILGRETGPLQPVPIREDALLRANLFPYRAAKLRAPDDPVRWMDDYDKILVERIVLGAPALPGTVLRLPMVYGPGDDLHRLFAYLKRMDDRRPVILLEETRARFRWTRGYVEDVALAIALAVTNDCAAGRIYNVGDPDALSEIDWVRAIARVVGWRGRVVAVPAERMPAPQPARNFEQDLLTDTSRIRADLGFRETLTTEDALLRSVVWERGHPPTIDPRDFDYAAEDAILAKVEPPINTA